MILDEKGDRDWVCIEPVVRVAGVELQFTLVIELALSKEVFFYFYMSQEEEGPPVLKGVGADARMSRYLDPRNLNRAALALVLLSNVPLFHLNMVLVARLDLDSTIAEERKLSRVADVYLTF